MRKLFVVTRSDLPPGDQATQSCHAALQFAVEHPTILSGWMVSSNTLALKSVSDESALAVLIEKAFLKDLRISVFKEPDLDNAITAIAIEPRGATLCSSLGLTLGP